MTCHKIKDGIICIANTEFKCPYCEKPYSDINDKYLDRCNRNKSGYTAIRCSCENRFGLTYDSTSDAVSFKLN